MYMGISVKGTQELNERLSNGQNRTNLMTKRNKVLLGL